MTIRDIFKKPVDRHIDGVIKADDQRSLLNEVEEYVITGEIFKALNKLVEQYLNNKAVNGVWISGFFGSGKSHLLKMLALLMENRQVDGHSTLELFLPKLEEDALLKANLEKVCQIPSQSILFNIAQKANIVNKSHSDALLSTFIKVFDEMCGYYGKQGYIAQFERDLDSRKLFDSFKEEYQKIAEIEWKEGREQALFETGNIADAYAKVTGANVQDASDILEKYRTHYQMSIEDFSKMVNQYILKQEKSFRLNFFIDEVGQYIAENVRLMTDLQTIAESLATICNGKAWIFVTAQEDMDSILGRMSKSSDFSKIQDRFKAKIKLSSANVDEVIRLRLLAKNDDGKDRLDSLYGEQQNNLKTLFDLPDGAKKYRNFKDRDHFVNSYPFIPYQFTLFQSSIQNLSKHDAFTGQYQSVGERSMLAVFQDVVKQIAREDVRSLATFDLMFEGVRDVIKTNVRWGITQSEQLIDDEFTKKVLKVLFLVKYVKDFLPTPRNLTVLLIDHFDQDLLVLRKQVEQSLATLESQTYLKRNEDIYEYLTDKERDIEKEIKHTDIDPQGISDKMAEVFFTTALNLSKIRYVVNGQDFPFTKRLDHQSIGNRVYELGIHLMTENKNKDDLRALSIKHDDLVVEVPDDPQFYAEIRLYLKTETYIKQYSGVHSSEETMIITDKSHLNQTRYEWIKRRAIELLGTSEMYVGGEDVATVASDPRIRISQGFQLLIQRIYPSLEMLGGARYDEKDIPNHLDAGKDALGDFLMDLSSAETEMLAFISRNRNAGIRTTVTTLSETFERKPNGWSYAAVLCLVARLYGMAKIELYMDRPLDDTTVLKTLRNSTYHSKIILLPVMDISPKKVKALKDVYLESFHSPAKASEAKALAIEFAESVEELRKDLDEYLQKIGIFPFLEQLSPVVVLLKKLQGKTYDWYYDNLEMFDEELPDLIENVVDPILSFMKSKQRTIYEDARSFLAVQQYNLQYVGGEEIGKLDDILNNPSCFRGNHMANGKVLKEILSEKLERKVSNTKNDKLATLAELQKKLEALNIYEKLEQNKREDISREFEDIEQQIKNTTQISMLNDRFRRFEEDEYPLLVSRVKGWSEIVSDPPPRNGILDTPPKPIPPRPTSKTMYANSIKPKYVKPFISDANDVEQYTEALKVILLAELEKGSTIIA